MAFPLISEWIRIHLIDRLTPPAFPNLTEPVVFGTTPGILNKNKLLTFQAPRDILSAFDASTPEYQMASKVLSQGRMYPPPAKVHIWNITRSDYRLASVITGSIADNNALIWYSDKFGDWGDRLNIALRNTTSGNNTLTHTVTAELNVGSGDAGVKFIQTEALTNVVRIQYKDPQKPNQQLKIEVLNADGFVPDERVEYRTLQGFYDYTIRITLATNAMEQITTVADDIVQALTNPANQAYNPLAAQLVDAINLGNGTGTVSAFPSTAIPIFVTIDLQDDGANITTKAWELKDYVNSNAQLAPLFLVSNYNVSNGTGTVWEETGQALMSEADPNPTGIADTDTGLRLAASDNEELAIEFTPTSTVKVASAYAKLRRVGNIADNKYVWFEVQTDSTGLPSGTAVATSAKILASSIPAVYGTFIEFKFPQHVSLTGGTTYHLVLKGDYTPSNTAYIAVATDNVTSGGVSEIKDAAWANVATANFAFRLFKEDPTDPYLDVRLANTPPSPLELTRGLAAMEFYVETRKLNMPYFLCCTSVDEVPGDRLELSNAMAAREGIYITTNTEEEAANLDILIDVMEAMKSDRTGMAAHSDPLRQRLDAAVVGFFSALAAAMAAGALGASNVGMTLFWGKLNAVTPAKWSATERRSLFRNAPGQTAAITYQDDFGNVFITGSWATDGSFLDWRWQKDYIKMYLTMAYYKMFSDGPPTYDNPGIGRIEAVTVNALDKLTERGFIGAWDVKRSKGIYRTNFPRIHQVDPIDFSRRIYRFTVQAQPAWAIEQLEAIYEFGFMGNIFAPAA